MFSVLFLEATYTQDTAIHHTYTVSILCCTPTKTLINILSILEYYHSFIYLSIYALKSIYTHTYIFTNHTYCVHIFGLRILVVRRSLLARWSITKIK